MKYTIVSLLLCLVFVLDASAQKVISLDFKTMAFDKDLEKFFKDLDEGEFYHVKVTNYNPNLYSMTLSKSDTILSKPITFPAPAALDLDGLTKALAGITSSTIAEIVADVKDDGKNVKEALKDAELFMDGFNGVDPTGEVVTELVTFANRIKPISDEVVALSLEIDGLYFSIAKYRLVAFAQSDQDLSALTADFSFEKALSAFNEAREKAASLDKRLTEFKNEYGKLVKDNAAIIEKSSKAKEVKKAVDGSVASTGTAIAKSAAIISADKANEALMGVLKINPSREYTSAPMQRMGDQTHLKLSFTPRDKSFGLESYEVNARLPYHKGTYAGLSTGFYAAHLGEETYSVQGVPINDSTSEYSLVAEGMPNIEIGSNILAKFGWQTTDEVPLGFHLNLGTGVAFRKQVDLRVFVGVGGSIGNRHKLSFDLLSAFGYTRRLSKAYSLNASYREKPENVTVSELKQALAYSIGYMYSF